MVSRLKIARMWSPLPTTCLHTFPRVGQTNAQNAASSPRYSASLLTDIAQALIQFGQSKGQLSQELSHLSCGNVQLPKPWHHSTAACVTGMDGSSQKISRGNRCQNLGWHSDDEEISKTAQTTRTTFSDQFRK